MCTDKKGDHTKIRHQRKYPQRPRSRKPDRSLTHAPMRPVPCSLFGCSTCVCLDRADITRNCLLAWPCYELLNRLLLASRIHLGGSNFCYVFGACEILSGEEYEGCVSPSVLAASAGVYKVTRNPSCMLANRCHITEGARSENSVGDQKRCKRCTSALDHERTGKHGCKGEVSLNIVNQNGLEGQSERNRGDPSS